MQIVKGSLTFISIVERLVQSMRCAKACFALTLRSIWPDAWTHKATKMKAFLGLK